MAIGDGGPMVVELAGPAGVGKSALADAMLARRPGTRASIWHQPRRRIAWSVPDMAAAGLTLARAGGRRRTGEPVKQMLRFAALDRWLDGPTAAASGLIVLDEGPVFALAWLLVFVPAELRTARFAAWWREMSRRAARRLRLVVMLDAPDDILAGRIRGRDKPHTVKASSDEEMGRFAAAFRAAFDEVVSALATPDGPLVLHMCAGHTASTELADRVLDAMEQSAVVH